MSTAMLAVQHGMDVLMQAVPLDDPPNPAPAAPEGMNGADSTIMGIVKYGALFVIIACGFVGAGALAGGHVMSHRRSSQVGIAMLGGAVVAALVYAMIYAFITGLTG